jgi:hypothetical protein
MRRHSGRMHFLMGMLAIASGLVSRPPASSDSLPGIGNGIGGSASLRIGPCRAIRAGRVPGGGQLEPGRPGPIGRPDLYSPASSRYPSGGGIGAIIGPCIEGNRRAWGSLTNSVDDDFE